MNALVPLLFVFLLAALATAGLTGVGVQDTRDTRYTLVCTPTRSERRLRVSEPVRSKPARRWGRFALPALAHRHLAP